MVIENVWEMFALYSIDHRTCALGGERNYSRFYGAMDAWHDTEVALYETRSVEYHKIPLLSCVGFLQALVTQQNVLITISNIFGKKIDVLKHDVFSTHRTLRDRVSGHPILQNGEVSTFFPSMSRGKDWFEVAFYGDSGRSNARISIPDFIDAHKIAISEVLPDIMTLAETLESKMFVEAPYETRVNGDIIDRGSRSWQEFKAFCNSINKPVKLTIHSCRFKSD